jgi:hypothetical protein
LVNKLPPNFKAFSLPGFVKLLDSKVWYIGINESRVPYEVQQTLRLGNDFICRPSDVSLSRQYSQVGISFSKLKSSSKTTKLEALLAHSSMFLRDNNLKVVESDKGMGPVVITVELETQLALSILENQAEFDKINKSKSEIILSFNKELQLLLPDKLSKKLSPKIEQLHLPIFQGLPKVHKHPLKLRPVVNASSCFTTNISKLLQEVLKPVLIRMEDFNLLNIRSTDQFIKKLKEIPADIIPSLKLQALDIESLYTNIEHKDVIIATTFFLDSTNRNTHEIKLDKGTISIENNLVINLLKIYLRYNYLQFNNNNEELILFQKKGIPTGGNVSPTLAMLVLSFYEVNFRENHASLFEKYRMSGRYLDDILIITTDTEYSAEKFQAMVYDNKFALKITSEVEHGYVFLDIVVTKETNPNRLKYKLYRKPGNAYMYIHYMSYIPAHVKKSFILNELIRIQKRCIDNEDVKSESEFFLKQLTKRGYPKKYLNSITKNKHIKQTKEGKKYDKWLVLPYQDLISSNEIRKILDIQPFIGISYKNQVKNNSRLKRHKP